MTTKQEPSFGNQDISLGAMGDSYYEYVLKVWLQGGRKEMKYRHMFDEDGIGDKLQLLIKALMVSMDDEDDCLAKVRQVLSIRDLRGRLPLHCAAQCPWVDERMILTLVNIYPVACYRQQAATESNKNYGIWTNVDIIRQMQSDATDESDVFVIQVLPIKDATTAYSRKTNYSMNPPFMIILLLIECVE